MKTARKSRRSPESSRRRARNSSNSASASVASGPQSGKPSLRCPPERSASPCHRNPDTAKNATATAGYHTAPTKEKPAMEPETLPAEAAAAAPPTEHEPLGDDVGHEGGRAACRLAL